MGDKCRTKEQCHAMSILDDTQCQNECKECYTYDYKPGTITYEFISVLALFYSLSLEVIGIHVFFSQIAMI